MTSLPILLAHRYTPIVKIGDNVIVGQLLAEQTKDRDIVINIARELIVPVNHVAKYIKKNPGDKIIPNDILAKKTSRLGFQEAVVESKIYGTVLRFERDTGNLVVRAQDDQREYHNFVDTSQIVSPVDGSISLCDNDRIVIKTDKDVVEGSNGIGDCVSGELILLEIKEGESVQLHHLDTQAIGKIVMGTTFSREVLLKAIGIGVLGIIGTGMDEQDMAYITEKNMKISVVQVTPDSYEKLRKWSKKNVFLNGAAKAIILLKA